MKIKSLAKNEKGFALLEIVISLAILGIIASGFLSALATSSKAISIADERTTAESLARSQMEDIKDQTYASSYNPSIPQDYVDIGYSATIDAVDLEIGLQKITVKIYHYDDAHVNPPVITLEGYKADR